MKTVMQCVRIFVMLTLLTGVAYPAIITAVAQIAMRDKANGSLVNLNGKTVGSALIGQQFSSSAYFLPRPSASGYSAMPSGAGNQGATSNALRTAIAERRKSLTPLFGDKTPSDMLLASGSGLDPHISPAAANAQIAHVARARHLNINAMAQLEALVAQSIEKPQFGIFGAPRVNVLQLNMKTDVAFGKPDANGN